MMNKFEKKAYELEMLGKMHNTLASEERWYMNYNIDTTEYTDPEEEYKLERLEVIRDLMKKVEKMI